MGQYPPQYPLACGLPQHSPHCFWCCFACRYVYWRCVYIVVLILGPWAPSRLPVQVLINPANAPISASNVSDSKTTPLQSTLSTTTTTTTTKWVVKDSRRLYTRRQQVTLPMGVDEHQQVDDPFEPKLNTQLWGWYRWLIAGGDEQGNTTSTAVAGLHDLPSQRD